MTSGPPRRRRVFVDANVLFTAAWNPKSLVSDLFDFTAAAELFTCELAAEEARRNLASKRPAALPLLSTLLAKLTIVPTASSGTAIPLNAKDRPIFWSAVAAAADYLVTGDHGFAEVAASPVCKGMKILTPRALLDELVGAAEAVHRQAEASRPAAPAATTSKGKKT